MFEDALTTERRVLLFGQAGIGKSTLARTLAHG
jgi:MoxR-like ATPase